MIDYKNFRAKGENNSYTRINEATRLQARTGNIIIVYLSWRGKNYVRQMFFPQIKRPTRREVQDQVRKVYPGSKLVTYQVSEYDSGEPIIQTR